eukprot:TRINITY_DN5205_c0_g1_i15.p1 TRINITY_DN5205_c0_g1~~TRINITY_DN5205_c0_g1_i15.p1  ORF type:complete len:146 (-),score=7.23 TRINITY_DN5205_c0_g1_i15:699-1136(-)
MILKQCINETYRVIAFDGIKNNPTVSLGARTIVWTDHIIWTKEGRVGKLENVLKRWLEEICLQDVEVRYIKGSENIEADYISWHINTIVPNIKEIIKYIHEEVRGHGSNLYIAEYLRDVGRYNPNLHEKIKKIKEQKFLGNCVYR